jgi:integrase
MPKEEALSLRDFYRSQIRAGIDPAKPGGSTRADAPRTFGEISTLYLDAWTGNRNDPQVVRALQRMELQTPEGLVKLSGVPMAAISAHDIEYLRSHWSTRPGARRGCKDGRVGANRMLRRLRHLFNWAIKHRHLETTPFRHHGVAMITLDTKAETPRSRRFEGNEEDRLAEAVKRNPFMKDLVVGLLGTGARPGELLSLQVPQVRRDRNGRLDCVVFVAEKTKTRRTRVVPVTDELREVLERRLKGPDGQLLGPGCHVFGSETGERRKSYKEIWKVILKDAGITGLQVRDLRREFGSQLQESGAQLHEVRDQLGHTDVKQTNTYLATTIGSRRQAIERLSDYRRIAKGKSA